MTTQRNAHALRGMRMPIPSPNALQSEAICDLLRYILNELENMTTEQFSKGADRPIRVKLATIIKEINA